MKKVGLQYLRYGPPLYKTHLGPGKYDGGFADETYNALKEMQLNPITDLCHFGLPDWMGGFDNPDWPEFFTEYARAFDLRSVKS